METPARKTRGARSGRALLSLAAMAALLASPPVGAAAPGPSSIEAFAQGSPGSSEGMLLASAEEELYFSREETVTGPAKREVKLAEAPANVTVITQEDIIQSGVRNLGEVFRRVAGMDVIQVSATEVDVSARGFASPVIDANKMAVFVDGRTFYLEFLGSSIWTQFPVPLEDIKRIEVIKGPMSSLYGNRALLGIINIVTYEPEETRTRISGGGGTQTYAEGNFINAGKFAEGYEYKISGTYHRMNNLSDYTGTGHHKDYDDFSAVGRFVAKPQEATRLELTGGALKGTGTVQVGGLTRWDDTRTLIDGRASHDFGEWGKLEFQSYWQRHYLSSDDFGYNAVMDEVDAEIRHSIGVDITEKIHNTTTFGFDYRMVGGSSPSIETLNNFAGFLQNETRFYDLVILTGGVRVDNQHDFAGTNVSAQGSLVFLIHPKYTLRLSGSTAFDTPTTVQYFTSVFTSPVPGITFAGNRNLKAERIVYFELGNTLTPIDKVKIRADFFYYRLNSLFTFDQRLVPPGVVEISVINDGGARALGGEFSVEADVTNWLAGYANYSYQNFAAINGNADPAANLGNPMHKASAGLRGKWLGGRVTANLDFHYTRKHQAQVGAIVVGAAPTTEIGDLYLLNARVAGWPIKDHLELALMANNILNDNTAQVPALDPALNLPLAEKPQFGIWGSMRYVF